MKYKENPNRFVIPYNNSNIVVDVSIERVRCFDGRRLRNTSTKIYYYFGEDFKSKYINIGDASGPTNKFVSKLHKKVINFCHPYFWEYVLKYYSSGDFQPRRNLNNNFFDGRLRYVPQQPDSYRISHKDTETTFEHLFTDSHGESFDICFSVYTEDDATVLETKNIIRERQRLERGIQERKKEKEKLLQLIEECEKQIIEYQKDIQILFESNQDFIEAFL